MVAISIATGAGIARGIVGRQLVEEGRLAHRLEHVEVVVAGRAVGAEADGNAGRAHRRDRRGAAGELHVALGIVRRRRRAGAPGSGSRPASGGHHAPRSSSAPRSPATRDSRPAWPDTSRCDVATSSFVSERWMMTGTWSRSASARHAFRVAAVERVHRVRRNGRRDQIVGLELLDELFGSRKPFRRRLGVRRPGTG